MAKKIDARKWKPNNSIEIHHDKEYKTETPYYYKTESLHGRSRARTACGFCEHPHDVYIWSFIGGGKRCENCGSLMFIHYTFAEIKSVINLDEKKFKIPS